MSNCWYFYVLLFLFIAFSKEAYTQDSTATIDKVITLPDKLFASIDKKTIAVENKLDQQTRRYLSRLQKQEDKLKKQLLKKDSALAHELFQDIDDQYRSLQTIPQNISKYSSVYSAHLDSLTTALNFLKNNNIASLTSNKDVGKTLQHLSQLQVRLNQTDRVKKYMQQRQQLLKEQFQKLGMVKELKRYQKQVFYYGAKMQELKQVFEDPGKLEVKLMETAMKIPQFKEFFAKNSHLGSLFPLPASGNDVNADASLQRLQTRAMLNEQLTQRFGSGADVTQMLQQNVQSAQSQLSDLKNNVNQYRSDAYRKSSSDIEQPDFKPNSVRTKSFLKRLEYGGNIQSQRARGYFPVTSDIAATLAYKLAENCSVGLGIVGKIGWGSSIQNIRITYQGVGLRSYVDLKLKGSFFISGAFELNQCAQIRSIEQFKDHSGWSEAGLLGVTKKYSLSRKLRGNVQLLWDFLSYQQRPRTNNAVLFRIGYNLK